MSKEQNAADVMTPEELAAFRKWQAEQATKAGVFWMPVEKHGNPEYDAAILVRTFPTGTTLRMELKHSGWVQFLWDFVPRRGSRPAAGNGCYRSRRKERLAYWQSADAVEDDKRLDSQTPLEALRDHRNQTPDDCPPAKVASRRRKRVAA